MTRKNAIGSALVVVSMMVTTAYACSLGYLSYEPKFAPGESSLSTDEIRRLVDWRTKIRGYQAGFDAYIAVWQNDFAEIPEQLAEKRASELRRLLLNLDIPEGDIKEVSVRRSTQRLSKAGAEQFFNVQRVDIAPHCPNACCDAPTPQ